MELTSNESPYEQNQAKYWHDHGLGHEHVPQAAHMKPQQWQLYQDEQEEAQ